MAIELGKAIIQPRLASLTELILPFKDTARISVCCARGGMRSRSFANFLAYNGFKVRQIAGGYRDYRATLTHQFEAFFSSTTCFALAGRTGVGKTMLLQALAQQLPCSSLDLEGCAQHRSSMFGSFGKVPRTQQQFESELLYRLWLYQQSLQSEFTSVFLEAEGSKIGNVHLPHSLRAGCDRGIYIMCTASMDTRIQRLIQEYWFEPSDEVALTHMQRIVGHPHLSKKLGSDMIRRLHDSLLKHDLREFVYLLLKHYYDPLYDHSLLKQSTYALTVDTEDIPTAVNNLQDFRERSRLK